MAKPEDNPGQGHDHGHQFQIHVDGNHFTVTQTSMTGAQIKGLVGKDAQYQLFLEQTGDEPDRPIADTEGVSIRNGMHFYTVPSASFGKARGN